MLVDVEEDDPIPACARLSEVEKLGRLARALARLPSSNSWSGQSVHGMSDAPTLLLDDHSCLEALGLTREIAVAVGSTDADDERPRSAPDR